MLVLVALGVGTLLAPVIHWDGGCRRYLAVSVETGSSSQPVADAEVTFISREYMIVEQDPDFPEAEGDRTEWLERVRPSARTGAEGTCTVGALFPAWGKKHFLWRSGSFGIVGDIDVNAVGFKRVRIPLGELIGHTRLSLGKRSPLKVTVNLERNDSHNNSVEDIGANRAESSR